MRRPSKKQLGQIFDGVGWLAAAALLIALPAMRRRAEPPPEPAAPLSDPRMMDAPAFDAAEPGRGRAAFHPTAIPWAGWKDILWRTWLEIGADRLGPVAAGLTFYVVLALFPAIGAFVSIYGLVADISTVGEQINELSLVFPADVVAMIGDAMIRLATTHETKLSFALVISIVLSLWGAKAGIGALFDGLNIAYDELEKRSYVRRTVLSYLAAGGLVIYAMVVTALLAGAPILMKLVGLGRLEPFWGPLRWVAVFLLTTLAFAVAYRYGPSRAPPRWSWVRMGALLASAAWLAGSVAFSWYLNNIAHYDATYGPLGGVVAFLVWLWLSAMIFLIGAELNGEIEHQTACDSTTGSPKPIGERGAAVADSVGAAVTKAAMWKQLGPLERLRLRLPKRGEPGHKHR